MKTHHESYNLNPSVKERVVCNLQNILDLQRPQTWNKDKINNPKERELAEEVFTKVNYHDLTPKILTR